MMALLRLFASLILALSSIVVAIGQPTTSSQWAPLEEDNTAILDVPGRDDANPNSWWDSYSVGDRCYCKSTFDHNIGNVRVETELGTLTVRQVCDLLAQQDGPPSATGRPRYNDIQCGHGPANDAGDETTCPGRVEYGAPGCAYIGPTWKLNYLVGIVPVGQGIIATMIAMIFRCTKL